MLEEQKTVAKGTFWGLAGSSVLKLASFFYLIILARLFTQADVGTFYLALSIIGMLMVFSDLGLSAAFSRYVPFFIGKGEEKKAYALLNASYLASGALSLVMATVIFLLSGEIATFFKNPELVIPLKFLAAYMFTNTFFSLNSSFLTGRKKMRDSNLLLSTQNILKLFLTVALFLAMGAGMEVLAMGFLGSYILATIFSFWLVRKSGGAEGMKKGGWTLSEHAALLKEVVPFGLVITIVITLWSIINFTDRIMIGYMLPPEISAESVAIYTIATALATLIPLFPGSVTSIFFPMISEMHGKNMSKELLALSKTALRWTIMLMVPLTILMISFPEEILQLFYGSAYATGASVLVIFSIGMFIRLISSVHSIILAAMRLIKIEMYAAGCAALANVALNWLLIPVYGIDGAAIASAISFGVVTIMMVYYSKKFSTFGFPKESYLPIIAAILSLIVILLLRGQVVWLFSQAQLPGLDSGMAGLLIQKTIRLGILGVVFALCCAVYFIALLLLKSIHEEDASLAVSGLRKIRAPAFLVNFVGRILSLGVSAKGKL